MTKPCATSLLLAAALLATACSSSGSSGQALTQGECKTGADAVWAQPAGTAFALPTGITLEGNVIKSLDPNATDKTCENAPTLEWGNEDLPVCLVFENTTGAPATLTLPAGLIFISEDVTTQNGIILQDHVLTLPAGKSTFRIDLFCLNEHCEPGAPEDRFTFGNVTNDALLREVIALAVGRKMDRNATQTALAFGQAVWAVTGGEGFPDRLRQEILDTPDGT